MGAAVFFSSVLTGRAGLSFLEWFKFILGIGSYLWFLSVLVICYFIVKSKNLPTPICLSLINVLSLLLTHFGFVDVII
jgi:hypothetical protein